MQYCTLPTSIKESYNICFLRWENTHFSLYMDYKLRYCSIGNVLSGLNLVLSMQKLLHELTYRQLFVGPSEMTFCPTKGGKLYKVIMHRVIWANQKTESFVYCWLHAHAAFDITCVPAFVGGWDVISSVLTICLFQHQHKIYIYMKLIFTHARRTD